MEETLEKITLLKDDIQNIYDGKDHYELEDLANLYSITVSTVKYIQRLSDEEVRRMSSLSVNKHQYKYIDEDDTPKPKKPKVKKSKKKEKKTYYKKKDPDERNYRKSALSEDKIRYIRANPDNLKMRELAQLLDTTIPAVDSIRQYRTCKYVKNEGSIFKPDPQKIEDIRNKSVYSQNTRRALTPEQVLTIRKSSQSDISLSQKYGVTRETIRQVKKRLSYKHVLDSGEVKPPKNSQRKLKDDEVRYVRKNPDNLTINQLAEKFKLSTSTIKKVRMGISYIYVK